MSDDKPEMVTLSYEVTVDRLKAMATRDGGYYLEQQAAARKALGARKSKYERWHDAWTDQRSLYIKLRETTNWDEGCSKTFSAAPQVMHALVAMCSAELEAGHDLEPQEIDAIRAGLPGDVADEILGVKP